jgi:hypothetical protein
MLLVLCDPSDVGALWAGLGLRSRVPDVEIVSTEELGSALRFDLRLDRSFRSVQIDLADGRHISSTELSGVLNRLQTVPTGQLDRAAASERTYAQAELEALHVSWLAALECPVINRPKPHGLCGAFRSDLEWAMLAAQAGLPVGSNLDNLDNLHRPVGDKSGVAGPGVHPPKSTLSLVVVDDEVTGSPVPSPVVDAARRLREVSGERVIGLTLHTTTTGPVFESATAVPDFRVGGSAVIDALSRSFNHVHPNNRKLVRT